MKRILIILWLMSCVAAQAEVYKWVDASGKTHFGDKAPEKARVEVMDKQLEKINVDESSRSIVPLSGATAEKTQDEKALEHKRIEKLRKAIGPYCEKMKKDIQSIARGDRGVFLDENGKDEKVPERERATKLEEFRERYAQVGCEQIDPLE